MSSYDPLDSYYEQPATLEEERPPRARKRSRGGGGVFFNIVAAFFMLATVAALVAVVFIAQRPEPIVLGPPTPTLIPFTPGADEMAAAEAVDEQAAEETATPPPPELTPTVTLTAQPTATNPGPVIGATNTPSLYPFTLQDNAVTYERYTGSEGCNYASIAGQVVDLEGQGINGLAVVVIGEDTDFEFIQYTGSETDLGTGGFEVIVNDQPLAAEFRVQLLNTTGQPFSEPIIVRTLADCNRNVARTVFEQNSEYNTP
ncbi:MAG: hypothetical protein GYB64_03650 [Chloroflexi bacterium]|nr:hypothetical protein [Chloroflexota bacterium]